MKQSTTNTKYSPNINSNKAYQRKHQKSPIDVMLDNKIHGILNGIIKNQQQAQQLNFLSVCKTMNKTYDNSDKLDELTSIIKKQDDKLIHLVNTINILSQQIEEQTQMNANNNMHIKLISDNNNMINHMKNQQILNNGKIDAMKKTLTNKQNIIAQKIGDLISNQIHNIKSLNKEQQKQFNMIDNKINNLQNEIKIWSRI